MISQKNIPQYQGKSLLKSHDFLYIPPHPSLTPYISCYTITIPTTLSDDYTILPTASSTIVVSVGSGSISTTLRSINTKPCTVGSHANKMQLLLLIEFHPGCLHPFIPIPQNELTDTSFNLYDLDQPLAKSIEAQLTNTDSIETLIKSLDQIFITRLTNFHTNKAKAIPSIKNKILKHNGTLTMTDLSAEFCYSPKHINRLFQQYVGIAPKTFSRIARVNYAIKLLQNNPANFLDAAIQTGFFDQPHFNHDFKTICGISPKDYTQNMSLFYNDIFKM